ILALNHQPPLVQTQRRTRENPTLNHDIFEIIDFGTFWTNLTMIAEILYSYCRILNNLQRDNAKLIHSYWSFVGASTNELGVVACRLYGICVNAAAVKHLWS
ncbi:766_t:CDS:2, partial [Gigaspora margarita]